MAQVKRATKRKDNGLERLFELAGHDLVGLERLLIAFQRVKTGAGRRRSKKSTKYH